MRKSVAILLATALLAVMPAAAVTHAHSCGTWMADRPDPRWFAFGQRWAHAVGMLVSVHRKYPIVLMAEEWRRAQRLGDTRLAILKRLGFRFLANGLVEVPTWEAFVEAYEKVLEEYVAAGRLQPKQKLRPGRAFRDRAGTVHLRDYRHEPDIDWVEVDVSRQPSIFFQMSRAGMFPVTDSPRAFHDLSHAAGILDSPEYMAGLGEMSARAENGDRRAHGRDRHIRFFFVYEGLSLVPRERREALRRYLSEPFQRHEPGFLFFRGAERDDQRLKTVDEVQRWLQGQSTTKVLRHAEKLLQAMPHLVHHYGGVGRDVGSLYNNREITENFPLLASRVALAMEHFLPDLPRHLAKLEVALWESTNVTIQDVFATLIPEKVSPSSALYRMFVDSGLSRPRSMLRATLCGEAEDLNASEFTFAGD